MISEFGLKYALLKLKVIKNAIDSEARYAANTRKEKSKPKRMGLHFDYIFIDEKVATKDTEV